MPVSPIEVLLAKRHVEVAILSVLACLAFKDSSHSKEFLISKCLQASYFFTVIHLTYICSPVQDH